MRNAAAVLVLGLVFAVGCWRQAPVGKPAAQQTGETEAGAATTPTTLPAGPAVAFTERSLEEYKDNQFRADEKYKGKRVRIADKVTSITKHDGRPAVTFFRRNSVQSEESPQVLCVFDDPKDVATLHQYFPTEVEGVLVGRVSDGIDRGLPGYDFHVLVDHCRLVKKKPSP